ncbi:DNA-primase RepB domain-containing protein [Methylobacter sp.]|uniref:DNA-primase RepB domain-containing protein n=1 Tax=Methylobacter sp. TaxID=2051955 RepID=UPI003DA476ED
MNNVFSLLPNFETADSETDKSDKTDSIMISNADFIERVFGEVIGTERPVVVSFAGNPATVGKGAWFGKPWIADKTLLFDNHNNYTSFATFRPDDEGKYRRQKKQFAALHAVMLDDIGVKVPPDRISLAPSWIIETSKDNYQYGYMLSEPLKDSAEADRLLTAIIEAGLTDPGANGPCSRIGRLPIAINGKYTDDSGAIWHCRLADWQPERRYSVQEIVDGLQIELKETSQQRRMQSRKGRAANDQPQDDDVHIPRADENPVIAALKASGRYKQPLGDGKHDITCLWVHEHTDQVDQGTAYFEPSESYPLGGFKCLHGHCADRRVSALNRFFEISKIEAKHKPMILVQPGELPRICDAAENELAKTLRHYQRGGVIVIITTDPSTQETTVKSLSLPSLTRALAGLAIWQRFDKRSEEWVICDPPDKHVRVLHDATVYPHLPVLNGIARQPYLRPDGSLMMNAGYDTATGMFGVFNARQFSVPATPTRQQAEQALVELSDLLSEFAFKTEHDKAAALTGILTAVIRPSLPQAPMFHVKAPSISSGKSYLCELLTAFATPQKGTPHAFPADDEECRKLLLAELLTAPAVLEFDNLTSDLIPHKSLCTALTSEFISGRILGQSKTAEVGTRALFLSSGNNVEPVRDMTRRTLTINLDPACETPAARDFNKQPVSEVRADRGRYVSLALIIVRAWHCAGRPKTACKTIASYSHWSDHCRQPLLWLGLPDPAECIFEAMNDDPDRELLGEFLQAWFTKFGKAPALVKDAITAAQTRGINFGYPNETLLEAITDIAGERDGSINRKRLGWWIKRHAGRVVNGLRLVQDTSTRNAAKWKVESV